MIIHNHPNAGGMEFPILGNRRCAMSQLNAGAVPRVGLKTMFPYKSYSPYKTYMD